MSHRPGRHQRRPSHGAFINFGSLPTLVTGDNDAGAPTPAVPAAPPMTPHAAPPVAAQPPLPAPALALAPAPALAPKPAALEENAAKDGAAKAKGLAD